MNNLTRGCSLSWALIAVAACGGGNKSAADANTDAPADAPIDAQVTLDCNTYCNAMHDSCTGDNAQYADTSQCTATCQKFAIGTSTVDDTSGNTLGCRIHYAVAPLSVANRCAFAGPAGDLLTLGTTTPGGCSGGDFCTTFCTLELAACGFVDQKLPGNPTDDNGQPLAQYSSDFSCTGRCAQLNRMHPYNLNAAGDSLACRFVHVVDAVVGVDPNGKRSCISTSPDEIPNNRCNGTATP